MERHTIFIGRKTILLSILPKMIYKLNTTPNKIPTAFLAEKEKPILKLQEVLNSQNNC